MINRTTRLDVFVSEVSLIASLRASASADRQDPPALAFSGTINPVDPDAQTDIWDLPQRLDGRPITVQCISAAHSPNFRCSTPTIGWCQFFPIAEDLDVTAELYCCPKVFHSLKNTVSFGGGHPRTGLVLKLDITENPDDAYQPERAVMRLPVIGMTLNAVRTFHTAGTGEFGGLLPTGVSLAASTGI